MTTPSTHPADASKSGTEIGMTTLQDQLAEALRRYVREVPLGSQPHMLALHAQNLLNAHESSRSKPAEVPAGMVLVPREVTPEMVEAWISTPPCESPGEFFGIAYRAMLAAAPQPQQAAPVAVPIGGVVNHTPTVRERAAGGLTPHPIADIICAWANGFRVEFRYRHLNPGIPEEIYLSDERWRLCGNAYSAWSAVNEHRIHADDLVAWEVFKRAASPQAATAEQPALSDAEIDARRYRYLRDEHIGDDPEAISLNRAKRPGLDAAVDAAIAALAKRRGKS